MSRRTLVAFPGALTKELLWERPDIVLFDEGGLWVVDAPGRSRRAVDPFSFAIDWAARADQTALLDAIREWGPIWTRWVANADQYEMLYREAALYVLHLESALAELGVAEVVFHTGISHHVDSSLFEVACVHAGVPQTFLYATALTGGRLLPLRQSRSVADRTPSTSIISDYEAQRDVAAFRENAAAGLPPTLGFFDGWLNRSFAFGVADAWYLDARQRMARLFRRFSSGRGATAEFLDQFAPLGGADLVRIMAGQRRAARYIAGRVSATPLNEIVAKSSGPVLLIAAHFQPEATSFPEGGELHSHLDIVGRIRALGYAEPIYYKEHIGSSHYYAPIVHQTRVGMCRSVSYYKRLEELGCVFVDPAVRIPLDRAINEKLLPVSITGTIALERSVVGLKTILSGHPWFKGIPGTVSLPACSLEDLTPSARDESDRLSRAAFAFLDSTLSRRTISNAPGIGTGQRLSGAGAVTTFRNELSAFLDELPRAVAPALRSVARQH